MIKNTNSFFAIQLPEYWEDVSVFTFKGPHDSGVQHNLVMVIDPSPPKGIDLTTYAHQQFGLSKEAFPGFELINEKEITLKSGTPAHEIVYKYSPSDDRTFFQKQVFVLAESKGYIFSSSFSKKTLKTVALEVDEIIASFQPLELE